MDGLSTTMLAALKLGHLVKLHTSLIKEKDFFSPPHLDNHGLEVTFLRSHTTDLLDIAAQEISVQNIVATS